MACEKEKAAYAAAQSNLATAHTTTVSAEENLSSARWAMVLALENAALCTAATDKRVIVLCLAAAAAGIESARKWIASAEKALYVAWAAEQSALETRKDALGKQWRCNHEIVSKAYEKKYGEPYPQSSWPWMDPGWFPNSLREDLDAVYKEYQRRFQVCIRNSKSCEEGCQMQKSIAGVTAWLDCIQECDDEFKNCLAQNVRWLEYYRRAAEARWRP